MVMTSIDVKIRHVFGDTPITEASIGAAPPGNSIAQSQIRYFNQMSHSLFIPNVFVSAIFRLISNCTRDMALATLDVYCLRECTNCTRNSTC